MVWTSAAAVPGTYLAPGVYWLAIRNTAASNVFYVNFSYVWGGVNTTATPNQTKPSMPALGATLDVVAATWTKGHRVCAVKLDGRVFGQTASF